jgi:hypothetical protein
MSIKRLQSSPLTATCSKPAAADSFAVCALLGVFLLGACSASADTSTTRPRGTQSASTAGTNGGQSASAGTGSSTDTSQPIGVIPISNPGGLHAQGGASAANAGRTGDGNTCAQGRQTTSPVIPTIWLIVDGSSSMTTMFAAGSSRWQTLRSTLMDTGGVVDSLQAVASFGMVIYSGGASDPTQCVQLVTVAPALNNLSALSAQYPMAPLGMGTPTHKALNHVVTDLPVLNQAQLDAKTQPVYVVLATDGQPNDNCGGGLGGAGTLTGTSVEQQVIDITTKGTQMGMNMFVISLAGSDQSLQKHLEMVAAATQTKTPPYVPSTKDDLVAAFRKIVGSASCQVALDGMVDKGQECSGTVQLNGVSLACNVADGWELTDAHTVQLTGTACDKFLSMDSQVDATFPCEIFTPN